MGIDWAGLRAGVMQDRSIINLNTGSFGPLPKVVFDRVTALRRELAEEPTHFFVRTVPEQLWAARVRLAEFVGCPADSLIFTQNVSAAINLVAAGLTLSSPGEILLTDHEYGAMHWCWERAAIRQGLTLRTFALPTMACSAEEIVAAARAAMSAQTRLFFFSHVLSPTGLVLPARELCAEARRRGIITVVDGAHAPALVPLDLADIGADYYGANCHKWLLAPTNSGFLAGGQGRLEQLQPLQVSWGYHHQRDKLHQRDEFGSTPVLRYLEFEGTRDPCPWLTIPEAIRFQEQIGWSNIRARIQELASYTRRAMAQQLGLPPATPAAEGRCAALTAFELPCQGPTCARLLRQAIWQHRIEIPIVERPDRLLLRFSTHFYNTEAEIDRLLAILPEALERVRTEAGSG